LVESQEQPTLRILLVDDDEDDYVWIRRILASEDSVQLDWAPSYEEGCAAIHAHAHDVILVDYRLRDEEGRDGLDVVRKAREEQAATPCVLFTNAPRSGLEIASLSAGAAGFLTKSEVSKSRLMHAILQALERGRTESELFQKNRALSLILRATKAANEAASAEHAFDACLHDLCAELGWEWSVALLASESDGLSLLTVHAKDDSESSVLADLRRQQLSNVKAWPMSEVFDTLHWVLCRNLEACEDVAYRELARLGVRSALLLPVMCRSEVVAVVELFTALPRQLHAGESDILTAVAAQLAQTVERARAQAERTRVEAELRRSQRLDALGRLAGGVAHDFNNLLTVITASTELLLLVDPVERTDEHLLTMRDAAQRGARLTHQLLALGRKNVLAPRIVDVNTLIRDSEPLLRRTLRENIELRLELSASAGCIEVDPNEFGQSLLNLVLNARDAIEGVGVLTIATELRMREVDNQGSRAKPLLCVEVRDTGAGMPDETLEHIFDPFFTTKGAGKGTGLGLASVYSIVRQAGGTIDVESQHGVGTTFRLYFPLRASPPSPQSARSIAADEVGPRGTETILLVEDDSSVRLTSVRVLESFGYRVLSAGSPEDALALVQRAGQIDLVLSDVVMPGMSGVELAGQLAKLRPGLPVHFMSGYAQSAVERQGLADVAGRLLAKPFTAQALARHVRKALDDARCMPSSAEQHGPH
jgi:signal transduction histidine kinase/DNA-binding response OmpR family regulator